VLAVFLTREEERMLNGELGPVVEKALKVILRVGESLGADKLVEISHAHVSGVSYFNISDYGVEFLEDLLRSGARFSVFTTANPFAVISGYGDRNFEPDIVDKQLRIIKSLRGMGAKYFTCTPYYVRKPSAGEHLAWAESSAVLYANSLLGAMTNREPGIIALLAGIVGRTYFGDAHRGLPGSADFLVSVERPREVSEAGAFGLLVGEAVGGGIAFVEGLEGLPETYIKEFLAAFAVKSPSHVVVLGGVTPGYNKVSTSKADRLRFSRSDIAGMYSESGIAECRAPLFLLGCPHLSTEELGEVLAKVGDVSRGEMWITVGDYQGIAKQQPPSSRGVKVIAGACAVVTKLSTLGVDCVVTDSAKALSYIPKLAGVRTFLTSRSRLVEMVRNLDRS
jgi:predicted aconitase